MALTVQGESVGVSINGSDPLPCSLDVTVEQIDVSTGIPTRGPDMAWEKVDKQGHFHTFTSDGKLPTLVTETITRPCRGGRDDPGCGGVQETRYRCRLCRQKIRPQWTLSYDTGPRSIPGRMDWSVAVRNSPVPPPDGEVSVKVTTPSATYFGFGRAYDATVIRRGAGVAADFTISGTSELGRRKNPVEQKNGAA